MIISTRQFGEIEYSREHVINFPNGLFGFENIKEYLFLKRDDDLFYWLNSIEQPDLCFPLFSLTALDEEYPAEENMESFGIVTLHADPLQITVNLKAPVYLNAEEKKAVQKIIDNENYSLNYKLFTT